MEDRDFFILYKPKDIVSGDFYYAQSHKPDSHTNELFFICTADCTGHGVPGALMSMMGISCLNGAILERNIFKAGEILDDVRKNIIQSLNPEGSTEESKDGMDCTLCVFDFKNSTLEFALANNPLWLVRNNVLTEYKADKMPVGKYGGDAKPFQTHTISLQKNDIVYTFTDGYADQFGGANGKKFKYKQLEETLLKHSNKPMNDQKEALDSIFEAWKGNFEQVDDVCVIGIRI